MNSGDLRIGLGSKGNLQSRQVDLCGQEFQFPLHLFDAAAHIAEFLGYIESVLDGGGAVQDLQELRLFGLRVAKAGIQIDVLARDILRFYALPIDGRRQVLDLGDCLIEASGWNADGNGCGVAATIGL